jgi:large subunit ribosomal protein L18
MAYSSSGDSRERRKKRIRKKVFGTSERPRLTIFRTNSHMYAQIVDDVRGATVASASTLCAELKGHEGHKGNIEAAKAVGRLIAERARGASVDKVVSISDPLTRVEGRGAVPALAARSCT